jgi:hypothetical protein
MEKLNKKSWDPSVTYIKNDKIWKIQENVFVYKFEHVWMTCTIHVTKIETLATIFIKKKTNGESTLR